MRRKIKFKKKKLFLGGNTNGGGSDVGNVMGSLSGIANMIPGWGQAIGGALNMVGGAFDQMDAEKKAKEADELATRNAVLANATGGWKNIPVGGGTLALGGELLKAFNAPGHSQGGQAVDQNGNPSTGANAVAEVEKDETIIGDYAFSPNLVDALSGKTFARASKAIESKYKKRLENGDDISRRTREKEMSRLRDNNDRVRADIEGQQESANLASMLQNIPQAMYGGKYKKNHGGPIGDPTKITGDQLLNVNNNPYGTGSFDDMMKAFGNDAKKLQQAMANYQKTSGNTYNMGGVDGIAGKKTKGFFDDGVRRAGFMQSLQQQDAANRASTIGVPNVNMTHPNQVTTMTQAEGGTPDGDADLVPMYKYLDDNNINPDNLGQAFANAMTKGNNLVNKSGKIVPLSEQQANASGASTTADANSPDSDTDVSAKSGGVSNFLGDLFGGKYDSEIGTAAKAAEMIGQGIMAFREPDQIDTEYNLRASEAEETVSRIGTSLTKARQDSLRGLDGALNVSSNAMSNAVKMALNQKAYNDYAQRGIDIAAKEKAMENQVAATLGNMQSRHGTEDKNARNMQEVKQSQTDAVSADAKKTYLESIGNMGEFFSKKGAAQKKSQEQLMLLGQKYTNFSVADLQTYNKAIRNGNINGIVKFVKGKNISLDQALADASGLSKAQKDKLKKQLQKDGDK